MSFYKENLDIRSFGGTITRADLQDIPLNAASSSDHVDGDAEEGVLKGIPISAATTGLGVGDTALGCWVKSSDNKWNWIYTTGAAIYGHKDWYGTPTGIGLTTAKNGTSFVANNQEAHIACGTSNEAQWFGYITYGQFTGTPINDWRLVDSKIPKPNTSAGSVYVYDHSVTSSASMSFDATYTYYYTVSLVYDYLQESPLLLPAAEAYSPIAEGDASSITVTIKAPTIASMNPRITAVKLYRKDSPIDDPLGAALWRLVKVVDIANSTSWTTSGGDRTIDVVDDNTFSYGGATYEQETGIAEDIESTDLKYTLNCALNGYHYAANCAKTGIADASLMLFRSQAYRFDTFNWSGLGEFIKLPTVPTAMVGYNNRLWLFDENRIYRVDPVNMVIEDITEGIGCLSQRSITVTDYGMFWCDAKNAYWHDGNSIIPIGDAIRSNDLTKQWHGSVTVSSPVVVFYPLKNTVIFGVADAGTSHYWFAWAFHVTKKRWDKWSQLESCASGTASYLFVGKNGELYCSTGSALTYPVGGSSIRACEWTTKELDFDSPSQKKRIYKFSVQTLSTETLGITYTLDGSATTSTFSQSSPKVLTPTNVYKAKIKISCDATEGAKSLSIQYRNFEGNR